MNFVTFSFFAFAVVTFCFFLSASPQQRKYILLVASYFFYGTWSIPLISVILFSTSVDYFLGNQIALTSSVQRKKLFLTTSILINCAILVYFKYTDFLLNTGVSLSHLLGFALPSHTPLNIILPLGVSFYTFEAISYVRDVYRGEKPATSWLN